MTRRYLSGLAGWILVITFGAAALLLLLAECADGYV